MMKKVVVIMTLLVLVVSLFANDLQQPNKVAKGAENFKTRGTEISHRNAPAVSFAVNPTEIAASFYDYMPGGYNTTPLRSQGEYSAPNGTQAGGQYYTFMYKETANSERRVYYSYIDNAGNISTAAPVSSVNIREGFPGIAIDPVTGNPFVAWHANSDADSFYECPFTYDGFNIVGTPGLWNAPFNLIDNPMEEAGQFAELGDFIWPVVNVGPSPDPAKRRVHIYANFAPTTGVAEYNCIYGYADVYFDEVAYGMVFSEWTFQTFPEWDQWQLGEERRAIKEIAVSPTDGKVVFVGHGGSDMFAMYSDNYGETFEYREFDYKFPVDNPQNLDGSYYFENEDGSPAVTFFQPNSDGSHFNAVFTDDAKKIVFMSAMSINTEESSAGGSYYPGIFHPKMFVYDTELNEYSFTDLQVTGANANDNQPMIPWDLDEDGTVDDNYDDEAGTVYFADVWPTYYYAGDAQDGSFHESLFKTTVNGNWVVTVFQDGRNLRQAYNENDEYLDWAETPEIAISVSSDYGMTWSDVAYMNALSTDVNYHAGLDGMTPVYVYAGDTITPIDGTNHGTLPIVFYDDNSFGSFEGSVGAGQPNGGTQMYAVIDIDFGAAYVPGTSNEGSTVPELFSSVKNYPNPFNPTTTISFNLKAAGNVKVEVFNSKGQKVNTLVDGFKSEGPQSVTWTGSDVNGKAVSSGIYFYKLTTEASSTTKKMVLMK